MPAFISKTIGYFKDSYQELKLVVWPKRSVLIQNTILVIIFSALVAAFLGLLDLGFVSGLQWLSAQF